MSTTISFRPLVRDDFGLLAGWLATPHVQRWWAHEFTPAAIEHDFGGCIDGTEPCDVWIVELAERPIGLIQDLAYAAYPEYLAELSAVVPVPDGAWSIDYFIGEPDLVGHGVGARMLAAFSAELWRRRPETSCLLVPVNSRNVASWRALERAGFTVAAIGDLEPDVVGDPPAHHVMRLDRTV